MKASSFSWKWFVAVILCLFAVYVASRLFHLTKFPIFTDEAIYIRWSQIGSRDSNWRFISLTDGKQPLYTWVLMALLKIIDDPLYAGRLVSVLAGIVTAFGVGFLSFELFKNKSITLLSVFLYVISPFSLVYDRIALYDSMSAAISIWNLYIAVLLVRYVRLDIGLIYGMTLGAGMLNKTSGFLSLYLTPISLFIFQLPKKGTTKKLVHWVIYVLIAALISQGIYSILRLSPFFHMIAQKDTVFVYSFGDWLNHPVQFLEGNLKGLFDWLTAYLTYPIFLAAIISVTLKGQLREKLFLFLAWLAPFFALALFGKVLYPRYIFFMTVPLYIMAAWGIHALLSRVRFVWIQVALIFLLVCPSLIADYYVLTDPKKSSIPMADRTQYFEDWPSGWGVREVNMWLATEAETKKLTVFTDGTFGLLPYAVEIYLVENPNIQIIGIWPLPDKLPLSIEQSAREKDTYMILNQTQERPLWPLRLVLEYPKGGRTDQKYRLMKVDLSLVPSL